LVLRRLAQPDPTGWLTQMIAPWPKQWTTTLGRFLIGAITEDDLFAAATAATVRAAPGHNCEAYYFAGMVRLLAREPGRAREYFEKSVATQLTHFPAYTLARAELTRLEALPQ
jgi:lipoprotein NlpI